MNSKYVTESRAGHVTFPSILSLHYILLMSVCRMSVVCQINCVGGITYGPRACSKSFFLAVKPVTPMLFISYTLEL